MIMRVPKFLRVLAIILAIAASLGVLFIATAFFLWFKVYLPRYRQRAEQSWATIGRPMSKFEKKRLQTVQENDSLRALTSDLRPFGISTLYKARFGKLNPDSLSVPKQITDLTNTSICPKSDEVDLTQRDLSYLNEHATDLDQLYKGVLRQPPAVWNLVPSDGVTLRVPSYLTARKMSQIIWVDALRKLERGDEQGAADAVTAGLKMTANIGEEPILVSQMIRVAIEALYAAVIARLPDDPDALKKFPNEVDARREMWRTAIQTETWAIMRVCDYPGATPDDFKMFYEKSSPFEKARISLSRSFLQANGAFFMISAAEQVRLSEQTKSSAISDLNLDQMGNAFSRLEPFVPHASGIAEMFRPNWSRSWLRLNAMLLLREQAELIRSARTQLWLGKSGRLADYASVVIPGAKWQITTNLATNSVSLKLAPVPPWTNDREAVDENFFLLPLDGREPWRFRPQFTAASSKDARSR